MSRVGRYTPVRFESSNRNNTLRDRAVVARRAHNPKVVGSNPAPATKIYVLSP